VHNTREDEECRSDPCTLNDSTTCFRSYALSAERTELEPGTGLEGLDSASQPSGVSLP
jgi:hypothetical protein